jgi:hypothetical protein
MDHSIGAYELGPVSVSENGCVFAMRFECKRCGLVVQATRDDPESNDKARAAVRHVCDPSKKDGWPAFDPAAPYTFHEKTQAILGRHHE